jgi:hypothetical protein
MDEQMNVWMDALLWCHAIEAVVYVVARARWGTGTWRLQAPTLRQLSARPSFGFGARPERGRKELCGGRWRGPSNIALREVTMRWMPNRKVQPMR